MIRNLGPSPSLKGLKVAFPLLVAGVLAGCVAPVATTTTTTPPPAAPAAVTMLEAPATAYLAQKDGAITLPAIPLEKVPAAYQRQEVAYQTDRPVGSIIIHPGQKFLYFVTGPNKAIRYGIGVGRAGFEWAGEAVVSQTKNWPTWTPPKEMIARSPELAKWANGQPGGPTNPLGARAIYLLSGGRDYGYRIHGSPDWWTIGKNASSGCIRMIQQDVVDLSKRVQPGASVLVLNADGSMPKGLKIPTPPKPKKTVAKTKPKPVAPKAAIQPVASEVVPVEATTPTPTGTAPAATTPVVPAPAVTTPAAAAPTVTAPAVTAPTVTAPAVTAPVVTAPAVTAPTVTAPLVTAPEQPKTPGTSGQVIIKPAP